MPTGSVEVVRVATPAMSWIVWISVEPLRNSTVPVGVPSPGMVGVTVAVSVTDWPKTLVVGAATRAVVVWAFATVTVVAGEVLVAKVVSPS